MGSFGQTTINGKVCDSFGQTYLIKFMDNPNGIFENEI